MQLDDGFWGITLANQSFYRNIKKYGDLLYNSRDDPALYQDYIHQMSEAIQSKIVRVKVAVFYQN